MFRGLTILGTSGRTSSTTEGASFAIRRTSAGTTARAAQLFAATTNPRIACDASKSSASSVTCNSRSAAPTPPTMRLARAVGHMPSGVRTKSARSRNHPRSKCTIISAATIGQSHVCFGNTESTLSKVIG
jgi:hypothetical protein